MVIIVGKVYCDTNSNLHKADCLLNSTNTLGKGMVPFILPAALGKLLG